MVASMKVVDFENSERGPQRRRGAGNRALHCCCICGRLDVWSDTWSTYCSERDLDEEAAIPKFCSTACRKKGGPNAANVTLEMREGAKAAEWRDPLPAYRDATDREKYFAATQRQRNRAQVIQSLGT